MMTALNTILSAFCASASSAGLTRDASLYPAAAVVAKPAPQGPAKTL